ILFDLLIVILIIIFLYTFRSDNPIKISGTYIKTPIETGEFHFIDNHGLPFSKKNLKGHWSMIFFGFTHCEVVCPTMMAELNKMYKKLQHDLPENLLPLIVFISVDPERDTIKQLNKFVNSFNPHFMGVNADIA